MSQKPMTSIEKSLACLLIQLHDPSYVESPGFYAIHKNGSVGHYQGPPHPIVITSGVDGVLPLDLMPRNATLIGHSSAIIVRDLPAAWQAHYAIRHYLTGEAPPPTPAPAPHTMAIEQTLLYAIMTQAKAIAPDVAIEMIADARADASAPSAASSDREHPLCEILDRTGSLIDGIFARVLDEIGPLPR